VADFVDRAVRASSFGTVAEDYNRYRPAPPEEAVAWLLPAASRSVLDLGAGTGALTEILARRVDRVTTVEADRRMAAVLSRRVRPAGVIVGRAEALPLRAADFDAVGVSSAWHWMDPDRTISEVARVLRPGGVLGVLWSGPDRQVPWVAEVLAGERRAEGATSDRPPADAPPDAAGGERSRVTERRLPPGELRAWFGPPGDTRSRTESAGTDDPDRSGRATGRGRPRFEVPEDGPFETPEGRTFTSSVAYDVADLVGLATSYSTVITLPETDRAELLRRLAERIATHPDLAGRRRIDLPLRCRAWRAVRR
jgi:SAM-dependent methyltransferase